MSQRFVDSHVVLASVMGVDGVAVADLRAALLTARKRFLFLALDVERGKAKGSAEALMAKFDKCVAKALKGEG